MILITLPIISQEIRDIEHDRNKWDQLTDQQKWESYITAHNSYLRLKSVYDRSEDEKDVLVEALDGTNKLLTNKWYPKLGFNISVLAGIDKQLGLDVYTSLVLKKYFLKGHAFIDIGVSLKIYDELGGGLLLGIGFTIQKKRSLF